MIMGLNQPYFMPYIGYWQLLSAVDEYVIYDDVNFIKGGWINRNNILINNTKHLFTISLSHASPNRKINEISIDDNFNKFLKTIQNSYYKAPFYNQTFNLIKKICDFPGVNLADFISNSIHEIVSYLNINTKIYRSSELQGVPESRGKDRVVNICKRLQASAYINAIGGQSLYDKEDFKLHNIDLFFLKTIPFEYQQFKKPFIDGLSIIDVLMFNNRESVCSLLQNYTLI